MEPTYGHERKESFHEMGSGVKMNQCFYLDMDDHPRLILAVTDTAGESSSVALALNAWMWTPCSPVTCISTLVHGSIVLELQGMLDGSVQLVRVDEADGRSVLLSYPIAQGDRIAQAQMLVQDGAFLDIIVLMNSGKLIAVEGVDLHNLALDPPPPPMTLFQNTRLRMARVGSKTDGDTFSMMQVGRNDDGSTAVFVANHGHSSVCRWTSFSARSAPDAAKETHSFINECSLPAKATAGAPLHMALTDDGSFLVLVSADRISWWDATSLTWLYDHDAPGIAAACSLAPWSLAIACWASGFVAVSTVALQYRGPRHSTIATVACTTFPSTGSSCALVQHGADLVFIGVGNNIETVRIYQQVAPISVPVLSQSPLSTLCEAMQETNHAVTADAFRHALWAHLQATPADVAACLDLTLPHSADMDVLFDAIESWCDDEVDGLVDAATLRAATAMRFRWTTFQLLCAPDVAPLQVASWIEFRHASLLDVLHVLTAQGAVARLQVLWRRHVDAAMVAAFSLARLPMDIPATAVRPWILDDVLPAYARFSVPLQGFTAALVQRASALADQGDVEEARLWTALLRPQRISRDRLWRHALLYDDAHASPHDALRSLDLQLQRLAYLDSVHGFHLSLGAFRRATMEGLAMSMLDRVLVPDLVTAEIDCHVQPLLALGDAVLLDDVLTAYVAEKASSLQLQQATEAQRCRVLLPRIGHVEKRARATLAFLQAVPAPYAAEIVALARTAAAWPSDCRVELQEQLRLMELQSMCLAYGLRQFVATDPRFAARFGRYICNQIDRPDALADALQLAGAFRHMRAERVVVAFAESVLVSAWTADRQARLLASQEALPSPVRFTVAAEVTAFALVRLETHEATGETVGFGDVLRYTLAYVTAALALAKAAEDEAVLGRTVTPALRRDLAKLETLHLEFGLVLSVASYRTPGRHTELLKAQLQPWTAALTAPAPSLKRKRVTPVIAAPMLLPLEATDALHTSQRLASLLGWTPDDFRAVAALAAATVGNVDQALRFARRASPAKLREVAVALLRHVVGARNVREAPAIGLAAELLGQATLHNARVSDAWPLLKLARLLESVYGCTEAEARRRDEAYEALVPWRVYDSWYRGSGVVLAPSVLPLALQFVLTLFTRADDEDRLAMAATPLIGRLEDAQAHQVALKALMQLPVLPEEVRPTLARQLDHMLSVVLHAPQIDRDLALGYLLSMDQPTAYSAFKKQIVRENVYKDFARLQQLARLGADAARNWEQIAFLNQCNELESNAKWWHHLTLLGIVCEHKAFQSERRDIKVLQAIVPQLLQATSLDLYCVLEFTRQYNIPDSYPCLLYVKALLLDAGCTDYASRIVGVLEDIHQHELMQMLVGVLGSLPTYDYARLRFVLELLLQANHGEKDEIQHRLAVLRFLEHFTPKLPFHELLQDPWAVLEPELSTASVVQLVSLSGPLELDPDEIYMRLIKKLVVAHSTEASLTLPFAEFTGVLRHLSSTQHKVTTTEWLADKYKPPFQAHTVAALEFALSLTTATDAAPSEATLPFLGAEATARLAAKLLRLQTEQCWQDVATHFATTAAPLPAPSFASAVELVGRLYDAFGAAAHKQLSPVVNAAASRIAELHQVALGAVRKEWVLRSLQVPYVDAAPASVWAAFGSDTNAAESDLVAKLVYACGAEPLDAIGPALWAFAANPAPRSGVTYRAKYRALQLLVELQRSLEQALPDVPETQLLEMLQHCEYLARFEVLGFPQAFHHFVAGNKAALVRSLWRDHHASPAVVALLSRLMLAYAIEDADLWQRLLTQMTALELFPELFRLLGPLSRLSVLSASSVDVVAMYDRVLLWPLQQLAVGAALSPADSVHVDAMLRSLVLHLQQCPFLERLDVRAIVDALRRLARTTLPAAADAAVECALTVPQPAARLALVRDLVTDDPAYVVALLRVIFRQPLARLEAGHSRFIAWLSELVVAEACTATVLAAADVAPVYCEYLATQLTSPALDLVVAELLAQNRMGDANHVAEMHFDRTRTTPPAGLPLEAYLAETTSPVLLAFQKEML
ncbi:hypothetical protein ACHHYP_04459 [Achlya hypogyna]|uniref:Uncharacterized protein n=1 Tax=Achlya hypogyna TaxID=1202772 RepID=A0A1V9Z1C0_ACHHY|nr:hypothetical protein ACHHYP_04459 [Achlya hypogyna]